MTILVVGDRAKVEPALKTLPYAKVINAVDVDGNPLPRARGDLGRSQVNLTSLSVGTGGLARPRCRPPPRPRDPIGLGGSQVSIPRYSVGIARMTSSTLVSPRATFSRAERRNSRKPSSERPSGGVRGRPALGDHAAELGVGS